MRLISRMMILMFVFLMIEAPIASSQTQQGEGPVVVGRISHVEGQLLRYVPDESDWVATVKDAPFGLDDALYGGRDSRSEIIIPNGSWIRTGSDTQIQAIAINAEVTEVDVASGVARFYNKSRDMVIKVTTPFGYVTAFGGTSFDIYVGDESIEVISLDGTVDFVVEGDSARYEVVAGSYSILCDGRTVGQGDGKVDADWDDWNAGRDDLWTERLQVKGDSIRYMPEELYEDSYTLEENGRWERVYYEGGYRNMWRPVRVGADWAPYTSGRWTVWNDDNCWVPDEPFGYVTHHYGNWIRMDTCNCWYWAPPVVSVSVATVPVLDPCGTCWYPGRVGWIHSGIDIGWVPLAPYETYYSYRYWGGRTTIINSTNIGAININVGNYSYINQAVIVNQNNFYNVNNYNNVRITNINKTTIINNYNGAPVINNTVINNYTSIKNRYNYNNNINVVNKPHDMVVDRIHRNQKFASDSRHVDSRSISKQVSGIREGRVRGDARIQEPRVSDRLVPADKMRKPKSDLSFDQRGLKKNERPPREISTDRLRGGRAGSESDPSDRTRVGRERPGRPGRPGEDTPGVRGPRGGN